MRWGLCYRGVPFRPTINGIPFSWMKLPKVLSMMRNEYLVEDGWKFNIIYGMTYLTEKETWKRKYLPPSGVKGKVILDIGAGAGETAKFFLDHGALHVVAVEMDEDILHLLKLNSVEHPITIIPKAFETKFLRIPHDFMKMDIEGYEAILFGSEEFESYDKDCVIEAHGNWVIDKLIDLGFKGDMTTLNYWAKTCIMHRWRTKKREEKNLRQNL